MREAVLERIVGIVKAIIARSLKSIRLGFGSYQWLFDGGLGSFFFSSMCSVCWVWTELSCSEALRHTIAFPIPGVTKTSSRQACVEQLEATQQLSLFEMFLANCEARALRRSQDILPVFASNDVFSMSYQPPTSLTKCTSANISATSVRRLSHQTLHLYCWWTKSYTSW